MALGKSWCVVTISNLDNLEQQFIDNILVDPKYLEVDLTLNYDANCIRQLQGICLGRPGSGKTLTADWIAQKITERYGANNVNCVWTRADLTRLLNGVRNKLVNYLFLDDITLTKLKPAELSRYFQIRHIIQKKTGMRHGLALTMLGLHRFHSVDPSIRTNFDFMVFRSAPTNKYDRNFAEEYITDEGLALLDALELERIKDISLFPISVVWIKGIGAGLINTPAPKQRCIKELQTYRVTYQQMRDHEKRAERIARELREKGII